MKTVALVLLLLFMGNMPVMAADTGVHQLTLGIALPEDTDVFDIKIMEDGMYVQRYIITHQFHQIHVTIRKVRPFDDTLAHYMEGFYPGYTIVNEYDVFSVSEHPAERIRIIDHLADLQNQVDGVKISTESWDFYCIILTPLEISDEYGETIDRSVDRITCSFLSRSVAVTKYRRHLLFPKNVLLSHYLDLTKLTPRVWYGKPCMRRKFCLCQIKQLHGCVLIHEMNFTRTRNTSSRELPFSLLDFL